jgi:hypothetical protein
MSYFQYGNITWYPETGAKEYYKDNWESLGGTLASGPDVSSWSAGRLDLFVRGWDNAIWNKWYDLV